MRRQITEQPGFLANVVRTVTPVAPVLGAGIAAAAQPIVRSSFGDFVSGLIAGDEPAVVKPVAKPKAPATASAAVTQAMAKGKTVKDTPILPQDRVLATLNNALKGGLTLGELGQATAMIPAAPKVTGKDLVLGTATQVSQQLFSQQVAQAQELAKTDPVAARAAVGKATSEFYQNLAGLAGANPMEAAMAEVLANQGK